MTMTSSNTVLLAVPQSDVLSEAVLAKGEMMRSYRDEGWDVAEIAAMFGQSVYWTKVLISGQKLYRFHCKACGAPLSQKTSVCGRCN